MVRSTHIELVFVLPLHAHPISPYLAHGGETRPERRSKPFSMGQEHPHHCWPAGETRPVPKHAGTAVMAGTLNVGGAALRVRVTKDAANSTVAVLRTLVEQALREKSRTERLVVTIAR